MAASACMRPPQYGQHRASTSKTRCKRSAHRVRRVGTFGGASPGRAPRRQCPRPPWLGPHGRRGRPSTALSPSLGMPHRPSTTDRSSRPSDSHLRGARFDRRHAQPDPPLHPRRRARASARPDLFHSHTAPGSPGDGTWCARGGGSAGRAVWDSKPGRRPGIGHSWTTAPLNTVSESEFSRSSSWKPGALCAIQRLLRAAPPAPTKPRK